MDGSDGTLATLQKLVDAFSLDVGRVRAALADDWTPEEARRLLVGALNYVLDSWDMFPDHYPGLGVADDALVLRVSAHLAVQAGAAHRGVQQMAGEMALVRSLLGDLAAPLERFCAALPDREVRGRKVAAILGDAGARAAFEADLTRLMRRHAAAPLRPGPGGPPALVDEMRRMLRNALGKAGFGP